MYTHKPALSLNRFFILNNYVKSYSYLVAISSQRNTSKFKIKYLPHTVCTKNISLTTESNKDATNCWKFPDPFVFSSISCDLVELMKLVI